MYGVMSQCRKKSYCPTSVIMVNAGSVIMAKKIQSVIMAKKIRASYNGEQRKMGEGERV